VLLKKGMESLSIKRGKARANLIMVFKIGTFHEL